IDIEDDGTVLIGSPNAENTQRAIDIIQGLTRDVEVGAVYTGKVTRIMAFGAFVEILPGKEGLVHISELADYRVGTGQEVVQVGDQISVLVTEIDRQGRINLSRRALLAPSEGDDSSRPPAPVGAGRPSSGGFVRGGPRPGEGGNAGRPNGRPPVGGNGPGFRGGDRGPARPGSRPPMRGP